MMLKQGMLLGAGSALAVWPRSLRVTLLPRVLGIYIAALAGGIQILDIAVDRFALDDRIFTFAVTLAIIGIPFAGAGAVLLDAARAERQLPRSSKPAVDIAPPGSVLTAADTASIESPAVHTAELHRRLEIALSYVRISQLQAETGDDAAAAAHRSRAVSELRELIAHLERLVSDSPEGRDAAAGVRVER